jgi:hypothetical protein
MSTIKANPNLTMFDIITDSRRWTSSNSKDLWEYLNKIGFLDIGDLHYLDDEHLWHAKESPSK